MEISSESLSNTRNFTVLDIGSDSIKCINFSFDKNDEITVLAKVNTLSGGIRGGSLLNVEKAKCAINKAIEDIERYSEEHIDEVYVNFSDCGMQSKALRARIDINNKKITQNEISILRKQVYAKLELPVIHMIPLSYHIDGVQEVINPVGMYGKTLSAHFYVITALKTLILNLENCLSQCNLKLKGCSVSAYSSAISCLTCDEMEIGAAVVDIGGSCTTIGIFQNDEYIASFVLPVGGIHITRDIACGLNMSFSSAEKVKKVYSGILLDNNNQKIDLSFARDKCVLSSDINSTDILDIVKPRIEEILEMVADKIEQYNLSQVIITGGSANIANLDSVAKKILGVTVRAGESRNVYNENWGPEYDASTGLVKILQERYREKSANKKSRSYVKKILSVLNIA